MLRVPWKARRSYETSQEKTDLKITTESQVGCDVYTCSPSLGDPGASVHPSTFRAEAPLRLFGQGRRKPKKLGKREASDLLSQTTAADSTSTPEMEQHLGLASILPSSPPYLTRGSLHRDQVLRIGGVGLRIRRSRQVWCQV